MPKLLQMKLLNFSAGNSDRVAIIRTVAMETNL